MLVCCPLLKLSTSSTVIAPEGNVVVVVGPVVVVEVGVVLVLAVEEVEALTVVDVAPFPNAVSDDAPPPPPQAASTTAEKETKFNNTTLDNFAILIRPWPKPFPCNNFLHFYLPNISWEKVDQKEYFCNELILLPYFNFCCNQDTFITVLMDQRLY